MHKGETTRIGHSVHSKFSDLRENVQKEGGDVNSKTQLVTRIGHCVHSKFSDLLANVQKEEEGGDVNSRTRLVVPLPCAWSMIHTTAYRGTKKRGERRQLQNATSRA